MNLAGRAVLIGGADVGAADEYVTCHLVRPQGGQPKDIVVLLAVLVYKYNTIYLCSV